MLSYQGADPMAEKTSNNSLYGPLKAVSEAEARRQFGEGATTVIRPGLIVGPGDETDRFTYWPVRLSRGAEVLAPGDGTDPVQFIDARDLAEWTIRMGRDADDRDLQRHGPRQAPGHAPVPGRRGRRRPGAAEAHLGLHQIPGGRRRVAVERPAGVDSGQGDTAGFARRDIGRALKAGLTYRPLGVTAADTLAWYRQQPAERQSAKMRAGLTPEREAALLAKWRAAGKAPAG